MLRSLVSVSTLLLLASQSAQAGNLKAVCGDAGAPTPAPTNQGGPKPVPTNPGNPTPAPTNQGNPTPAPTNQGSSTPAPSDPSDKNWSFKPVRSIKVRVQGNLPVWDADHKAYISSFGADFDAKYRGVLDTVNMASVEGAFKYVQAECINYYDVKNLNCQRKNNVQYVVFYETVVAQPRAAMAKYQRGLDNSSIEHCPFVPMDGGQCTPTNGVLPKYCDEYTGANGSPKLGFCVGGDLRDKEYLAPYPDTYWFSFPNSCPSKVWAQKTAECRASDAGGLCPYGTKPDGVKCTFSFEILGWVKLDDVVGITSMVNPKTNAMYGNYTEFCQAGGIEYKVNTDNNKLTVEETLPFWKDPASREANSQRAKTLVEVYNKQIQANPKSADGGVMKPLPTTASLVKENPPCYHNNVLCAEAKFGCRRRSYAQICEVCPSESSDCDVAPSFPSSEHKVLLILSKNDTSCVLRDASCFVL